MSFQFTFSDVLHFPVKHESTWLYFFLFNNVIEFIVACSIQGHHNNVYVSSSNVQHSPVVSFSLWNACNFSPSQEEKLFHEQCRQCDFFFFFESKSSYRQLDCTCGVLYVVTSFHFQVRGSDVLHAAAGNILEHSGSVYHLPPTAEKSSQSYCLTSNLVPHICLPVESSYLV